ncbi:MAG TPA: F0F1 ATP synthase subunit B [Pseudothermotoga sp.]|nr:F0F1 ATP synthase subunit B [Pseudothermotoga sp.]HOK83237.1 F0F1 ATP synthase subunit B [Pseudothermotoga sp.]HPP70063.1 F0F1 ATP synthase subunit B [Pseudothermotoga sp.]
MGFVELNLTGIVQLLNFFILLFALYKLLYKPFTQIMDKRREKVESELAQAEKERKAAQEMKKEAEQILTNARQVAEKIVSDAKQRSDELIAQAKNQAREEADRIMNSARAEIEREKQQALDDVEKKAGEIAVTLAMKILQGVLDEKAKREYLVNILKKGQSE